MKRKVYIFNGTSRATAYGIGTYIKQLTDCLIDTDIEFEVIYLHSQNSGNEVTVTEESGYKQISIPAIASTAKKSAQYYQRNVAYLLKEFISDNKDTQYIFHLNFMANPNLVVMLKKMFKCKIITTIHYANWSFALQGNQEKLIELLTKKKLDSKEKAIVKEIKADKKMLEKSDCFICVAQHALDSFRDVYTLDTSKGVVINNALKDAYRQLSPDERRTIKQKYSIAEQTKILIFVGRLDEAKGLRVLISAYKEVLKTNPDTHLFIAGDGDFNSWLSEAKNDWLKISFTGKLDKEQLYELYSIADIGVMPSYYEQCSYVGIEMMMFGLPIVASDGMGVKEMFTDNVNAKIAPIGNREKPEEFQNNLTASIIEILQSPELAERLGGETRKIYEEKYESKKMKDKYIELIDSLG